MTQKVIGNIALFSVAAVFVGGLVAGIWWLFQQAWNYLAPVFGLPALSYWQAAVLLILVGFVGNAVRGK